MHQSQQQKIRNWFGGMSEKDYTQEENKKHTKFQQEEVNMEEESKKTQKVASKEKKKMQLYLVTKKQKKDKTKT
eukprot:6199026-Ditylum_brightwellii.AAC.1